MYIELFTSAVIVLLFVCVWFVQVERKKLEKEMGDLGLDMNDKDDVSSSEPKGNVDTINWIWINRVGLLYHFLLIYYIQLYYSYNFNINVLFLFWIFLALSAMVRTHNVLHLLILLNKLLNK